jgi:membrane associated rhomboid family serine protease
MSITLLIVLITAGLSMYAWQKDGLLYKLVLNPYQVQKKHEYYRFITSGFVHADYIHLIFNMLSFLSFGFAVEHLYNQTYGAYGSVLFLFLYLTGIIISDIPSYLKNRHHTRYNSLGASGGVSTIIFASVISYPLEGVGVIIFVLPGFLFAVLYLSYCAYLAKNSGDNINHDAHLYGGLYGVVASLILDPSLAFSFVKAIGTFNPFDWKWVI